jgi:peptidoglycan hydrolase-like protein with peptidoglycan-binding domain
MAKIVVLGTLAAISITPLLLVGLPSNATPASPSPNSQHSTQHPTQHPMNPPSTSGGMHSNASHQTMPILRMGSRGQSVNTLQSFLKKENLYTGAVNGVFNQETRTAVIAFQQSKHLRADGIVGRATWQAIGGV